MILGYILSSTPPPDFFNNPFWQFLSGIGAVIAIPIAVLATITAILAYRQQQHRKEIAYRMISNAPIASISKLMEDRVEIRLDGNPIKDAKLLVMQVWNSGNASVRSEDYFEPLKFKLEDGTIISTDILNTNPQDLLDKQILKTFLKSGADFVEFPPFPLNPQDSISFSMLLSGTGKFHHRGRIDQGNIINYKTYILSQYSSLIRRIFIIGPITVFISIISLIFLFINVAWVAIIGTSCAFLLSIYVLYITFIARDRLLKRWG